MKHLFKNWFNKSIYLLLAAVILFISAFLLNRYVIGVISARYYAGVIEKRIQKKERDFQKLAADTALLGTLIDHRYDDSRLDGMLEDELGFGFFIYEAAFKDSSSEPRLLFWNTQKVLPRIDEPEDVQGSSLQLLPNGSYVHVMRMLNFRTGRNLYIKALIPVRYKYVVENEHLKKQFAGFPAAITQVDIAQDVTPYPVSSTYGNVLFYLQPITLRNHQTTIWPIILVIAGFLLLFLYLHQVAHQLYTRYGFWYGVAFLAFIILLMRLSTYVFPQLLSLRQFELFDPAIYSSSYVLSSLGDLFINALLICWLVVFINRRVHVASIKTYQPTWKNWPLLVAVLTGLVILTFTLADILQSLVSDAQISFNVTNFFSLTLYSFIGFIILATLALTYFFLAQIFLTIAGILAAKEKYLIYIITTGIGLLILSFTRNHAFVELNIYVLLWLLLFIWLMQRKIFSGLNFRLNVSEVLFWLFLFSFSMSAVIIFENRKIELEQQRRFVDRLAWQYDPGNEHLLSVTLAYLDSNFLVQNFERFKDSQTNAFIKDSIIQNSLAVFVSKYNTKIYTFDSSGHALFNTDAGSYDTLNTIFKVQAKETSSEINMPDLKYFERSFDRIAYVYRKEVHDSSGARLGSLFVLSESKEFKTGALTPELFKQSKELVPEYSSVYSYAIYKDRSLSMHYNDYPFPTYLDSSQALRADGYTRGRNSFEESWYHPLPNVVVVLAHKNNYFIEAITLFAYLFSAFLLLLAFYRFVSFLIRTRFQWTLIKQYWQPTIRSQIHSTIIMVSLLSFIVIGIATIIFFTSRYNRTNQERLTKSMNLMVEQMENELKDGLWLYEPMFKEDVEELVQGASRIHGMDVNLYDTLGRLYCTSNSDLNIYSAGVLSTRMNPYAYYRLNTLREIQSVARESVGKIDYLSIYSPLRNADGRAIAYLNIPSYSTQSELQQEISYLLVTIINLNAFIFLIAGIISLFLTNRITSSFTIISQKMRDVNLGKMNQQIEWKREDEIGVLVKEYNKMLQELEKSAAALAKSEREGAWRQMARQVAHEIKNPLTPMKLSIQYLQKAIDNNSPNVKELTGNVARTLVEQIDHLSKIASDFSQFANIGNPKSEVFDLHEMLYSLTSLYESTENLDFSWQRVNHRVLLFADKTQLNRLFTNLMQNAVEASAHRAQHIIHMGEELNGEYITVSITDNGSGIPEATQSKIFTPNFTTKSSGTGLGLAMSKSIVEQAKGDIWFTTREGEGTTFYVKIPLLRATN